MKYGLIGEKLGHSFSKEIHEKIANYTYELKEISKENIIEFIQKKEFKAINVTIPYKETVIPYIDFIDEKALEIGAVNTIINKSNKLYAYNTDYLGLKALITDNDININNEKVLVLGTGGTSKTANVVLKDLQAKEILFVTRNKKDNCITYDEAKLYHNDATIIINTSPCGMYPNDDDPIIDINSFYNLKAVVDVVYNPLKTKLIRYSENIGIKAVGGLYMLVAQAVYAKYKFLDEKLENQQIKDTIRSIYEELLSKKQNIVLIGMPGCGKSTIGKILSDKLNKEYIDTDIEIEKEINCKIKDYLTESNENDFRNIETGVAKKVSLLNNRIISTGGGIIKRKENIISLKANGIILFIDRNIEKLSMDDSRPLSSTYDKLKLLFEQRYPLYKSSCDFVISNDKDIDSVIDDILKLKVIKYE